ncbi:hypothetical protein [Bradyrhizobium canariense]|uniref:Uncharacterized protein n=1 Tax=Bradyrhizobium canariense TaxID=255045 RepID=A0A1H2BQL7_9BRAD|nr:hypothetical protein [Bradyrhizobium canariense]SDT60463.1 hypothetical protein SAMN05444158_7432 [Bradyrhizobium canariense]
MKLISALVGLAALGGIALATAPASAMPVAIPGQASHASNVEQVSYVCNEWGHCWDRPDMSGGYDHPHYWRWHHWHPYYSGGYGYGWHHWHPHYYGGWGYGGWHHWHHWHQW